MITHGMSKTPEYKIWGLMINRCENQKTPGYRKYGARGISICAAWRESFMSFYRDMGPRPTPEYSIDRINTNGNYEPGNCRWATLDVQANNRRTNRIVNYRGADMSLTLAMRASGCALGLAGVRYRLDNGWSLERALTEPADPRPPAKTHCPNGHALSVYNVTVTKQGYRNCRTCSVERTKAARKLQKQLRRESRAA